MFKQPPYDLSRARRYPALLALVLLVVLCPLQPPTASLSAQTEPRYLLLKLSPAAWEAPQLAFSHRNLSQWERLPVPGWVRIRLAQDDVATLAVLREEPGVQAIEEDHRVRIALTPDDVFWGFQWGPEMVRAPDAWNIQTGSPDVIVAVLDTGIDRQHSDLAGQIWVNAGEIPDNGQDDDQNGYVDDVHGWNVLDDGSNEIDDDHGHGTHVSGIIAARGNNGQGIAGMAWESRVMVVKVLDEYGEGYYSGLAQGITYAADNGAQVINLSLGGAASSQVLQDAVNYAHARGTLVVAAAGNTNSDIQYPAACDHVLAVASSTSDDVRAGYSCSGPEMDLTAPGTSIYSTCIEDRYCIKSGTSMAAPHVAGLAAMVYAQAPTYTPDQVAQLLKDTAQDLGDPGWDPLTGWGRIDAYRALFKMQARFNTYIPIIEIPYWKHGP